MNTTAQIDMTGSGPDQNGLEDATCPFHGDGNQPTVFLDHIRGAFLCVVCRALGAFSVSVNQGRRFVSMTLQSYRK